MILRIQGKIALFVTSLLVVVIGSLVVNMVWTERRAIRQASAARLDVLMEGVMRITRESLSSHDELMLLSYLKFLMEQYPEIELALVSRNGHSSVLGKVRTELYYRTVTVTEKNAAAYRVSDGGGIAKAAETSASLPPETLAIQVGFSLSALERQVRSAQTALAVKMLRLAAMAFLIGLAGSIWISRLLAQPLVLLALAAKGVGEGRLDTTVPVHGRDEIADLAGQFNLMVGKIRDSIQFKEDLMATLTHELSNPLAGLKGFLKFLHDSGSTQSPEERQQDYETLLEAATQMELSLNNALKLFKSGAGQLTLRLEKVSMKEVVDEATNLFTPSARANNVTLTGPAEGAPMLVWADKELIRRVVVNLISNALRYTPQGGRVTAALHDRGGAVEVTVADNGPGIAPEFQERIFVKFFRVPGPDGKASRIPGSGLGLHITKQAVDLHGGRIWVESAPGQGSAFHVLVPKEPKTA
ncbi:MAG: HAMP domain-containing sensor histidine kinase [Elusimicrobiota bacterium]